jgi:hypothetical protein
MWIGYCGIIEYCSNKKKTSYLEDLKADMYCLTARRKTAYSDAGKIYTLLNATLDV